MKKIFAIAAIIMGMFLFTGCGEQTADGATVSVECGEGGCSDITIGDGNLQTTSTGVDGTTPSVAFDLDNYDETYDASTCNDLGFFYCSIEQKCLPQPLNTGTCLATE